MRNAISSQPVICFNQLSHNSFLPQTIWIAITRRIDNEPKVSKKQNPGMHKVQSAIVYKTLIKKSGQQRKVLPFLEEPLMFRLHPFVNFLCCLSGFFRVFWRGHPCIAGITNLYRIRIKQRKRFTQGFSRGVKFKNFLKDDK